jgi:cyclopropane-fatty-acyl-phospholipid synthase
VKSALRTGDVDMTSITQSTVSSASRNALAALQTLFGDSYARDFSIALWDGTFVPANGSERFVFCVNDAGALRAAFASANDLDAGRAIAAGRIDITGDIECAVGALLRAGTRLTLARKLKLFFELRSRPAEPTPVLREATLRGRLHSRRRDRAAIEFHYDQPVEFYASFLDPELLYSCAYFDEGVETLDRAQAAKMQYILRKLRLAPGQRFLDIGCGWGGLVLAAARRGAIALGVTLSRKQYEEGQRRIAQTGYQDRARIELRDYRDLAGERFDKIASVGMFEHVGRSRLHEYFKAAFEALEPGGLFLNHGIASEGDGRTNGKCTGFMQQLVFPDGELVPISDALVRAERAGFEVRDVENLREHYVRTLRAWVSNLERNRRVAERSAGTQAYRAWRLYMAGSAQGFRTGRLCIFQSLLARRREDGSVRVPPTRHDIYR